MPTREQARLRTRYGPWAVVTGASSGIGRETAVLLAEAGLNLVLVARTRALLDQLGQELTARHAVEVRVLSLDLAAGAAVGELATATADLDVGLLVAAAGFGTSGPFLDTLDAAEEEMLAVNCRAVLGLTRVFGRRFAARGRGGVVLFASIVGFQGVPNAAHYAATKAYVQSLGEALAVEWKPLGIDVLTSAPGPTRSGFGDRAGMTMGAALTPQEVARGTLRALGRRATTLPGLLTKVLTWSLATAPRWLRVRIMGGIMSGMTGKRVKPPRTPVPG
ncbi:MAG: SDR family oxidoreductase [Fimbriiglobus sp.]|nr:SDR family oxidoreductase [Fimbriiglobus sp.]